MMQRSSLFSQINYISSPLPISFTVLILYRQHVAKHTLPHKCPHPSCNIAFSYQKDLVRHLSTRKHRDDAHLEGVSSNMVFCQVRWCRRSKEGFARRDHYVRHVRKMLSSTRRPHRNRIAYSLRLGDAIIQVTHMGLWNNAKQRRLPLQRVPALKPPIS
ncbi:hypothetical protein K469DRAFT_400405 [Zopfia rhizophila CBS 207.26]|uniref:C2H2-type domain-containing protein n=1 Tax=Zopfia rhizophila CBS 207.26 TaxID=1314779 RepID=A0A6A6DBV4_9PEZI|nr:hypothetical protein K469DRAFT_400405 [Zopfia rhizophila CBS 207.26]